MDKIIADWGEYNFKFEFKIYISWIPFIREKHIFSDFQRLISHLINVGSALDLQGSEINACTSFLHDPLYPFFKTSFCAQYMYMYNRCYSAPLTGSAT